MWLTPEQWRCLRGNTVLTTSEAQVRGGVVVFVGVRIVGNVSGDRHSESAMALRRRLFAGGRRVGHAPLAAVVWIDMKNITINATTSNTTANANKIPHHQHHQSTLPPPPTKATKTTTPTHPLRRWPRPLGVSCRPRRSFQLAAAAAAAPLSPQPPPPPPTDWNRLCLGRVPAPERRRRPPRLGSRAPKKPTRACYIRTCRATEIKKAPCVRAGRGRGGCIPCQQQTREGKMSQPLKR